MNTAAQFFDERKYPNLVDLLRSDAQLIIGENVHMDGLAQIRIQDEIIQPTRTTYESVDELLKDLDALAKKYMNSNW